jgi:hypothetical protein
MTGYDGYGLGAEVVVALTHSTDDVDPPFNQVYLLGLISVAFGAEG